MSYAQKQNRKFHEIRNRSENCPTHRNELKNLGGFYLDSACDLSRVSEDTKELLLDHCTHLYLTFNSIVPLYPCDGQGADSLEQINKHVVEQIPLPVFNGGTDGILGITKAIERGAHDFVHFSAQAPFSLSGEFQAFMLQARFLEIFGRKNGYKFSPVFQGISVLYSEIYLQACAYDYLGRYPDSQKIVLTATPYRPLYY